MLWGGLLNLSDRGIRTIVARTSPDWALEQFRSHCNDPSISKWDIFHYVYAVLHHPEYRERYAANLRRELPRVPFVGASGAKAQIKSDADAAINDRSSTNAGVRGKNSPERPLNAQANARSFDSGTGRASASSGPAHDDSSGEMRDLDVFRAFVRAGERLADIHVHYEQQPEYPLTKTEKAGERLDYRWKR